MKNNEIEKSQEDRLR